MHHCISRFTSPRFNAFNAWDYTMHHCISCFTSTHFKAFNACFHTTFHCISRAISPLFGGPGRDFYLI